MPRFAPLASLFVTGAALAVGTRTFELDDGDDLEGGDLQGVAVDSAGRVSAGFNLRTTPISDATALWSLLVLDDGQLLVGTGNEGKLLRFDGTSVSVAADTEALVITSLVKAWGNSVVFGTLPDGKVMRYQGGSTSVLAALADTEHVWQVAFDPKAAVVFAATGPTGKLWRITATGEAQVFFDAEERHLLSVAVAPDGSVYAGSSEKAKLYRVTGPGRASVVYDFDKTEVRAIAVAPSGDIYAIANDIKSGSSRPTPSRTGKDGSTAEPSQKTSKAKGTGQLFHFTSDGKPTKLLEDSAEYYVSLGLGPDAKPYVGTGAEGRVYSVDEAHNSVLVADTKERQVSALVVGAGTGFVASSDPAVLHPIRGMGGPDAVWTSKVLDAGLRAKFGRMTWVASGTLELSTRSGNTSKPDDTWSDWSAGVTVPGIVDCPAARYLQVRARWNRDPAAVLHEVRLPFVTDNLRAVISKVSSDSDSGKPTSSKSGLTKSGGPISDKPETKVSLSWKVDNPDEDELRYRIEYRMLGSDVWYPILKPGERLTSTSYKWDTADLPEGRYRVRVTATDELANPPDRVQRDMRESAIVIVDNTPPTVEALRIEGKWLRAVAIDGVGPIQRVEVCSVGSDEWLPFYPRDGVFDEQREEIDVDVSGWREAKPVVLAVRVYDQANNYVVRNVTLGP